MSEFVDTNLVTLDDLRIHSHAVTEYALTGEHVLISDNGKPVVALIPYVDFKALISEMEDLDDIRDVAAFIAKHRKNPDGEAVWERLVPGQDECSG